MEEYRSLSLNLTLPDEFQEQIEVVHNKLANQFPDLRRYDTRVHIALFTKFLTPQESTENYIALLSEIVEKFGQIDISFIEPTSSADQKYVFLNLDEDSVLKLKKYRQEVLEHTSSFGLDALPGYPEREYSPHISLLKIDPINALAALEQAKFFAQDLLKLSIRIAQLELTEMQTDVDGNRIFPVVKTFQLKYNSLWPTDTL